MEKGGTGPPSTKNSGKKTLYFIWAPYIADYIALFYRYCPGLRRGLFLLPVWHGEYDGSRPAKGGEMQKCRRLPSK
ncbi:hypothetical protein PbDSM24746_37660 [Paenibacillus macerans]|nr:hypothetical protein PbDSM24746_37660 [Paenibacillus macerans]GBK70075.1 hypothetical protein PbJCM17693_37830 [Paenibacillus macerans]GIP09403.1 hypothetical protein J1TS5_15730 [Paenibacillus macerans]